jgi:hypothetical protein
LASLAWQIPGTPSTANVAGVRKCFLVYVLVTVITFSACVLSVGGTAVFAKGLLALDIKTSDCE